MSDIVKIVPSATTYRPHDNPGPGRLAQVARYSAKNGACTYKWKRERRRSRDAGQLVEASFTTGEENVLNVDAYKPGDFHIFFDDPRTRQEYLQWAPLLLEAEECHAGNRDVKPNPHVVPARKPVIRGERPVDLKLEKPRAPKPPVGAEYHKVRVALRYDVTTKGGTKFKAGEILNAIGYYRRELTLRDPKNPERSVRGVSIRDVVIVGKVEST